MKMSDVKVGMVLKSTYDYDVFGPITVIELTEKGFKYTHAPKTMKIGYAAPGIPEFGTATGGEHFDINGEINYEPLTRQEHLDLIDTQICDLEQKKIVNLKEVYEDSNLEPEEEDSIVNDILTEYYIDLEKLENQKMFIANNDYDESEVQLVHPDISKIQLEDLYQRMNREVSKENILKIADLILYHLNIGKKNEK